MSDDSTVPYANSLESLSHGTASSANPFRLEDLTWEHFWIDESDGNLQSNREAAPVINEASDHFGGLEGKSVLELGAYEGYDSRALERCGAEKITAIEGNPRNFLKCCAVKNHYQLNRTQYLLGDCGVYLDACDQRFDLVVASGILYHLFDPIAALENICRLTNVISICTTYYHPEIQAFKFTGATKPIEIPGMEGYLLHERANPNVVKGKKHGMNTMAWMFDFETLVAYLELKGFKYDIMMRKEIPESLKVRTRILAYR